MLLSGLKNGDYGAFRQFYDGWNKRVYGYFLKKTESVELSKELTQECFIRFWRFRETLSPGLTLDAQLFQNARMVWIDELRRQSKQQKHFSDTDLSEIDIFSGEDVPAKLENKDLVEHYLKALPPVRKKVFVLYRLHGYSYKEIASELSISTKTVENHLSKAMKQLRALGTAELLVLIYLIT